MAVTQPLIAPGDRPPHMPQMPEKSLPIALAILGAALAGCLMWVGLVDVAAVVWRLL